MNKMLNNFDNSSTGINIHCGFEKDYDDSHLFDENFEKIKGDVLLYTDFGNLSNKIELFDLLKFKGNTKKYSKEHLDYLERSFEYTKEDIIREIVENNFRFEYLEKDIREFNESQEFLKVSLNKDYHIFTSKGFSQGDCIEVVLDTKEYRKALGIKRINYEGLQKLIDRLLWETPISGIITINDDEFLYSEIAEDEYKYNKKDLIQVLLKQCDKKYNKKILEQELKKVLVKEID